jgi:hypothetical protein
MGRRAYSFPVEIIDRGDERGADLTQIAYADTREEAALIRGLLREAKIQSIARQAGAEAGASTSAFLLGTPRRIYVRPGDAVAARELIGEIMVEEPVEEEIPEPANATYLAEAEGRGPRDYNVLGAYARAWLIGVAVLGLILVAFLLLR